MCLPFYFDSSRSRRARGDGETGSQITRRRLVMRGQIFSESRPFQSGLIRAEGRKEGREEGRKEGRKEGRASNTKEDKRNL